jgi:hypothetical protein
MVFLPGRRLYRFFFFFYRLYRIGWTLVVGYQHSHIRFAPHVLTHACHIVYVASSHIGHGANARLSPRFPKTPAVYRDRWCFLCLFPESGSPGTLRGPTPCEPRRLSWEISSLAAFSNRIHSQSPQNTTKVVLARSKIIVRTKVSSECAFGCLDCDCGRDQE